METKPTIWIERTAWMRLRSLILGCKTEIQGFGVVENIDGRLYITEIILPKQEAGPGHTEIDQASLSEIINDRVATDPRFAEKLKLWWHSHAGFETFLSGTDHGTIDRLLSYGKYVIAIVMNHKSEKCVSLHIGDPVRCELEGCNLEVYDGNEDDLEAAAKAEIAAKVLEPTANRLINCVDGDGTTAISWPDYQKREANKDSQLHLIDNEAEVEAWCERETKRQYDNYAATSTALGRKAMSFEDWRRTYGE